MQDWAPVTFGVSEIWILQSVIRHESADQEKWHNPPSSRSLNGKVSEALLACSKYDLDQYTLELTLGDCLALDYGVKQGIKDVDGKDLSKPLLLKIFAARDAVENGPEEQTAYRAEVTPEKWQALKDLLAPPKEVV